MREETLPLSHFESIYARGEDPWGFASNPYEREKYAATLAALPRPRYRSAFEVGCSIGVLTSLLAERCDALLAVEPVLSALDAARRRNGDHAHVRFAPMFVPQDWPTERFDLIVLSEVLDYLGRDAIGTIAGRIRETLEPDGNLVLVHWLGKKRTETATPSEASEVLVAALGDAVLVSFQQRNAAYRLDVLTRL
jgi:cyclopropane fatty-acyl-phospholipid synthase-like methyltransferase